MLFKTLFSKPAPSAAPAKKFGAEREALYLACSGMGDCLFSIPVIKKLAAKSEGKSLDVFTYHPALFRHCPYVDNVYQIDDPILNDYSAIRKLFDLDILRHWEIDTFDFISIPAGLGQLSFREKQLEYFPEEEDQADAYDVVLNTSVTWPTRTWKLEHWQRLADVLAAKGYRVAVVGKDVQSPHEDFLKASHPLAGCANLVNRLSLDQTYFTIRKCKLFVSCQNGLSVLAGATDTEIVVLDMSIEWSKRAIFRQEDPHYKITYVKGGCGIYCCSPSNYCVRPDFEYDNNFLCVPGYDAVEAAVLAKLAA